MPLCICSVSESFPSWVCIYLSSRFLYYLSKFVLLYLNTHFSYSMSLHVSFVLPLYWMFCHGETCALLWHQILVSVFEKLYLWRKSQAGPDSYEKKSQVCHPWILGISTICIFLENTSLLSNWANTSCPLLNYNLHRFSEIIVDLLIGFPINNIMRPAVGPSYGLFVGRSAEPPDNPARPHWPLPTVHTTQAQNQNWRPARASLLFIHNRPNVPPT